MPRRTIFLGPPGTGKTHNLLEVMDAEMRAGVDSSSIGYVAFTKRAAQIAKDRAMAKFNLRDEDLPFFRTLHSLAFRQLGLKREQVMQRSHYQELGEALGMDLRAGSKELDGTGYGMSKEERLVFVEGLSRIKHEDLRKTWEDADEDEIDWWELERFSRSLVEYKKQRMVLDFTDIVWNFVDQPSSAVPRLEVLIIDETQDLSRSQWKMVEKLEARSDRVYFGGDDDQALFHFAGSDVEHFINLEGEVKVLSQSYRLPVAVHSLAESITRQISNRRPKEYLPKNSPGEVRWYAGMEEVDLRSGTWLLLARNGYMLTELEEMCVREGFSFESVSQTPLKSDSLKAIKIWEALRRGKGVAVEDVGKVARFMSPGVGIHKDTRDKLKKADQEEFVTLDELSSRFGFLTRKIWHESMDRISEKEREFFIAARKHDETLTGKPRIMISTIHSAKGGEAQNVLLMTDMSHKTFLQMGKNPDNEYRTWYVGVSRAAESLHVVSPQTNLFFEL